MKTSALSFLVCPVCKSDLDLQVQSREGAEVVEGHLSCRACRSAYPVLGGIPRFVQSGAYASSFGRQWNWFRTVQLDSVNGTNQSEQMLAATTGWTADHYRGRLVLDAGVGSARFAEIVAKHGGEVVGIDLTTAVEAAYANIGRAPNVHLLQADIFAMPLRDRTFDLAYSIGVLHHTHDTRAAFDHVAAAVKDGGDLAVYLYHSYGSHYAGDVIRQVTSRLPFPVMLAFAATAIPLYYLYRIPLLGGVLQLVYPISTHSHWRWRWLDTFDWYTPKYQWKFQHPEVFRWFRSKGFVDIEIFDDAIRMRGTRARPKFERRSKLASTTGRTHQVEDYVASAV